MFEIIRSSASKRGIIMKVKKLLLIGLLIPVLLSPVMSLAKVVGNTIILGATLSLTGKYSTNGYHAQRGYDLAVKEINNKGGVKVNGKNYQLFILYYDDESDPRRAATLAERLIKQDKIQFMLGPYSLHMTVGVAKVTEQHKVPLVEANGFTRRVYQYLFSLSSQYLFSLSSPADQYLVSAVDLAVEKNRGKPVKIALVYEQSFFSNGVIKGVSDAAKRTGSLIIINNVLPVGRLNDIPSETLVKVRTTKPDLLIVSGHSRGASTAIKQMAQLGVKIPMLAMTHCEAAKISKRYGKNSAYTLCPTQWDKTIKYKGKYFATSEEYDKVFRV
jgi:branched-chain amino acid transport system substrate-binding protein